MTTGTEPGVWGTEIFSIRHRGGRTDFRTPILTDVFAPISGPIFDIMWNRYQLQADRGRMTRPGSGPRGTGLRGSQGEEVTGSVPRLPVADPKANGQTCRPQGL